MLQRIPVKLRVVETVDLCLRNVDHTVILQPPNQRYADSMHIVKARGGTDGLPFPPQSIDIGVVKIE
jgi:hypothetical protein